MKKVLLIILAVAAWVFIQPEYEFNTKNRYEFNTKNRIISAITIWSSISLGYSKLHSDLNEATINLRYDDLALHCVYAASPLGERSCYAPIRSANGIDSWYVIFFFSKDRLQRVKLDIPPSAHKDMISYLNQMYGTPVNVPRLKGHQQLIGWTLPNGLIATEKTPLQDELSQFLWISSEHAYTRR